MVNSMSEKSSNAYKQFCLNPIATEQFNEIKTFCLKCEISAYVFHYDQLNQKNEVLSIGVYAHGIRIHNKIDEFMYADNQPTFRSIIVWYDNIAKNFQMFAQIESVEKKCSKGYWIQFEKTKNCDDKLVKKVLLWYKNFRRKLYAIRGI